MNTTTTETSQLGQLVHVAPGDLIMNRNIRTATPDKALIDSVRQVGVLEPITAVQTPEGALVVRFGHRRTLAAIQAALPTVPVYVAAADDATDAGQISRVITQRDENTHREGLTASDELGVIAELAGYGLSAAQIAKRSRIKRDTVDTALAVTGSETATNAITEHTMPLDYAAALVEFEDDPETVADLIAKFNDWPNRFPHELAAARRTRKRSDARARAAAQAEAEGITLREAPTYSEPASTATVSDLRDDSGEPVDIDAHRNCPGHVAWVTVEEVDIDPTTGKEAVYPEEPDWTPGGDQDAYDAALDAYEAEYEAISARTVTGYVGHIEHGCSDWIANGHKHRYRSAETMPKPTGENRTEAQKEADRKTRALVIANNKAWDAAEDVRRDWLAQLAKAKTPPKGTAAFIAEALALNSEVVEANYRGHLQLAATWLGIKTTPTQRPNLTPAEGTTENRALVIVLITVLAGFETRLERSSWREDGTKNRAGRYLRFLAASGYTLSDVEEYAISKKTV